MKNERPKDYWKNWSNLIAKARKKHPNLSDKQLAEGLCLEGETPAEMLRLIERADQYVSVRDEIKHEQPEWDAENLAEYMCDHPKMAETFIATRGLRLSDLEELFIKGVNSKSQQEDGR